MKDVFDVGIGFYNKKLPKFIYNTTKKTIESYIYGIIMGDGSFYDKRFILTTSSFHLPRDIVLLLRFIGYKNITISKTFTDKIKKATKDRYTIRVNDNYTCSNKTGTITKNDILTKRKINYSNKNNCTYNGLEEIQTIINEKHEEYVYDVSVEDNENFFCGIGPICAHNTIADEGLDIPSLSALIMAGGGKSPTRAKQRVGRVIRKGSPFALVYDFIDLGKWTKKHSRARINILQEEPEFKVSTIKASSILHSEKELF